MSISVEDFEKFVDGDELAFEAIFCQYYKTLVSYAMRYELTLAEAEDIVQEIFYHIWSIRKELKSPAGLHSLLYTAVRNRVFNAFRDFKKHQELLAENYQEEEYTEDTRDFIMEEEMNRLLDIAIGKLSKQCGFVVGGLLAGKSLQDIAVEMEVSVNSVKTYKSRAIKELRELFKDNPFYVLLIWIYIDKKINFLKKSHFPCHRI